MNVNAAKSHAYSIAGYAELWRHKGQIFLIMGNIVQKREDGTLWFWTANWTSGERNDAAAVELEPYEGCQPTLLEVVRQVGHWAREGNADAMWWLADFYEFGSRETGANGGKALAYYLGAIRCEPRWYDRDTVARVLQDGAKLFRAGHHDGVEDKTLTDVGAFLSRFREYRAIETEGQIYFPDTQDWRECVAIAEALP